jgi:chromosome segregation ATPase
VADGEELEQRVAALETQMQSLAERVGRSEHDAASARVLAGGADRDVSEIRAEIRDFRDQNNRVLNAMRSDLADLTERVDGGFAHVRAALDATAAGQSRIVELLDQLIRRDS